MNPMLGVILGMAIGAFICTCIVMCYAAITIADAMLERNRLIKERTRSKK